MTVISILFNFDWLYPAHGVTYTSDGLFCGMFRELEAFAQPHVSLDL